MNKTDESDLVMPRSLAITILHAAQIAQPQSIRGVVGARAGEPHSFLLNGELSTAADSVWADLWSRPQAAAVPLATELREGGISLLVSLNTKGVLEMRAWQLRDGQPQERVLKIRD